jgi:hypothetical protein
VDAPDLNRRQDIFGSAHAEQLPCKQALDDVTRDIVTRDFPRLAADGNCRGPDRPLQNCLFRQSQGSFELLYGNSQVAAERCSDAKSYKVHQYLPT